MSTHKGLALHRAVVQSADAATGICLVYLPAVAGTSAIPVPPAGLPFVDGVYQVPAVGDVLMVACDTAGSSFHWVTAPYPAALAVDVTLPRGTVAMSSTDTPLELPTAEGPQIVPGMSVTFNATALRRYRISVQGFLSAGTEATVTGTIRNSLGTDVGHWASFAIPAEFPAPFVAQSGFTVFTPYETGPQTFSLTVDSSLNDVVTISATPARPTTMLVEDIGTVPNPTVAPTWGGGVKWGQTYWSVNPAPWSEALWGQGTWQ